MAYFVFFWDVNCESRQLWGEACLTYIYYIRSINISLTIKMEEQIMLKIQFCKILLLWMENFQKTLNFFFFSSGGQRHPSQLA